MCKSGAEKLNSNLKNKNICGLYWALNSFEDDSCKSEAIV